MPAGVYKTEKKDGSCYYRGNLTFNNKHISIGSFDDETACSLAYLEAKNILSNTDINPVNLQSHINKLSFEKAIVLLNFRDNHIYIKTPIYLEKNYFNYYISPEIILKFDNDDLFYYSSHKIQMRGGHLFVSDYGMQYNILGRYGIRPYSVKNRDYTFANGDESDFRYSNIIVINKYYGVTAVVKNGKTRYLAKIHLQGDFVIGRYPHEATAAIAYNKAVDLCKSRGMKKNFPQNYVSEYSPKEYADIYTNLKISPEIYKFFRNKNFRDT